MRSRKFFHMKDGTVIVSDYEGCAPSLFEQSADELNQKLRSSTTFMLWQAGKIYILFTSEISHVHMEYS